MDVVKSKKRKSLIKSKWLLGGVGVAFIFAVGNWVLDDAIPFIQKDTLIIAQVSKGEFYRKVRGTGVFAPREVTWVTTEVDGMVEQVYVKPGNSVELGQPLLKLFNRQLIQQVTEAEFELNVAKNDLIALQVKLNSDRLNQESALAKAQTTYLSSKLQMDSEAELSEANIIPKVEFERTQLRVKQDEFIVSLEESKLKKLEESFAAQLTAQKSRIALLENVLSSRRKDVEELMIVADREGVVQEIAAFKGQKLQMGEDVARIVNLQDLIAEIQVPEVLARDLKNGQIAHVDTRTEVLTGEVIRINPQVIDGTVQVDIAINDPLPAGARPDLSVDAEIEVETLQDVLFVRKPASSSPSSSGYVYTVSDSGDIAKRTRVQFGKSSSSTIQILDGLKTGDRIILTDMAQWIENEEVKLTQ